MGATWAAANLRDLQISWPHYLAASPNEVIQIFEALQAAANATEGLAKKARMAPLNDCGEAMAQIPARGLQGQLRVRSITRTQDTSMAVHGAYRGQTR